jgi:hypothetical protein
VLGSRITGAEGYYTVSQILDQVTEATGKKAQFYQIDDKTYKSYLPDFMAQEMLENHFLIENPGYYNGEELEKIHAILDVKEWAGTIAAWKT